MADEIKMVAGIDVGNGYVKVKVSTDIHGDHTIDMPSALAFASGQSLPKAPGLSFIDNLAREAAIDVTSTAVDPSFQGRVFMGERALRSGSPLVEFEIDSARPKCEDSLSSMLVLDVVAAEALRAWSLAHAEPNQKKNLPLPEDTLVVHATVGLALPIEDYVAWRDAYAKKFMNGNHMVRFTDFEMPVDVKIIFDDIVVLPEAMAAQWAIVNLGPRFLDAALDDSRKRGLVVDDGVTGERLRAARTVIGIDLGEGTVNLIAVVNGSAAPEVSSSIRRGWGSVLEDVIADLRATASPFGSRKALSDFLMQDPKQMMPVQARLHTEVQHRVDEASRILAREIISEFSSVFRRTGVMTEAVYVYGGGATPIKDILFPMITKSLELPTGTVPVLWMDSTYSRDLNRNGLFDAAKMADDANAKKGAA